MKNKQNVDLCEHGFPLFQSCDKCGREMVKDAIQKPEWEKEFKDKYFSANVEVISTKKGDAIIDFIRNLLTKQESEHKKEMKCPVCFEPIVFIQKDDDDERVCFDCVIKEEIEQIREQDMEIINELKQQHREELEGLRMKRLDEIDHIDIGHNEAVDEINTKITKLLNQKEK